VLFKIILKCRFDPYFKYAIDAYISDKKNRKIQTGMPVLLFRRIFSW
jgi:hypothetical protein